MEHTKVIAYRGGLVTFALPSHWQEEYEPEGGGTFFEDRPDSGTLRLNVITVAPPPASQLPSPLALLASVAKQHGGQPKLLLSGNALLRCTTHAVEGGTPITLHYWHLASCTPPAPPRVAIYSYTVASAIESSSLIQAELSFLEQSLPETSFAPFAGV
jgi:hypothetical protein